MSRLLLSFSFLFTLAAGADLKPQICVNEGGRCTGMYPCCGDNSCVRGTCRYVRPFLPLQSMNGDLQPDMSSNPHSPNR